MSFEEDLYSASPPWVRDVLMSAHGYRIRQHRYGAAMLQLADDFETLSRSSRGVIENFQSDRLRFVLSNAVDGSQFYRYAMLESGCEARQEFAASGLSELPLLTKAQLRQQLDSILTRSIPGRDWQHGHTSGTTGSPLSLWYDRVTCQATNAADLLQKRWAGMRDGEWIGLLLGRQITPQTQNVPPFWQRNFALKQVWFSSLHLSHANLPAYVGEMRRARLSYLEGYPSTLFVLARHLLQRGESLPMKAVFSSSETLLDMQREAIESAFEAPLYDFYGHAERTVFAIECSEHAGKHLVEPYGITEIVDEAGKPVPEGEFGYIVGTSLFNTAMPMIRYRTNDISALDSSPCPCGSHFRRIVGVSTKAEDIVVLPDGRWLSPSALTHPFKSFPQIVESQIVQESTTYVCVRVVAGPDFSISHERELLDGLKARLGIAVSIDIQRVDRIPRERSGKFRWVVSKVPNEMRLGWSEKGA